MWVHGETRPARSRSLPATPLVLKQRLGIRLMGDLHSARCCLGATRSASCSTASSTGLGAVAAACWRWWATSALAKRRYWHTRRNELTTCACCGRAAYKRKRTFRLLGCSSYCVQLSARCTRFRRPSQRHCRVPWPCGRLGRRTASPLERRPSACSGRVCRVRSSTGARGRHAMARRIECR
jgi:hypothetical protein